jgi:hypothetical protein
MITSIDLHDLTPDLRDIRMESGRLRASKSIPRNRHQARTTHHNGLHNTKERNA